MYKEEELINNDLHLTFICKAFFNYLECSV